MYFFEEDEVHAHADQKGAAAYGDGLGMGEELVDKGREGIAEDHQDDIADPDAGNKAKAAFMPIVKALLDDREYDGSYR
jgi:hypothetical protein